MKDIRIATVIFNSRVGKVHENLDRTIGWIKTAKQQGAEIVIFPEMNLTGYGIDAKIRDAAQTIPGEITDILQKLSDREQIAILAGMAEKDERNNIYASHLVIQPDIPIGIYRKLHIAPPEKPIFSAGNHIPIFEAPSVRFGIQLCYDAHFPELSTAMAVKDAEIIFIPHASPHGTSESKFNSWTRHLPARAYDNSIFVIVCNACGDNGNGLTFPGVAVAYDPSGNVLDKCLSDKDNLMIADLKASDMEKVRGHRMRFFLPHRRTDLKHNNI